MSATTTTPTPTPTTILATICVVDSSLALAMEWPKVFTDYLTPIIQRLAELTSNVNQFRIGFITYALASSRPSPLLCQRFFQPSLPMSKEMKEEPLKLSIGSTGIGSSSGGMAVLEGIVAALEMFDKLRQSIGLNPGQSQIQQPNKPAVTLVSHILHLAAAPPDGSLHPLWNANPKFDQLAWATLPEEFKQRQINYSIVTVRHIPRFKEIFLSTNSTDASTPWFDVAPNHTIMLSGFPPKGLKRPTEPTTPTPDPKRPRQDLATKPAPDPSPTDAPPNPEPTTPATNPAPATNPLSVATIPPAKREEFMEKYRKLQEEIREGLAIVKGANTGSVSQEVIRAKRDEVVRKMGLYQQLTALLGQKKTPASTATVPTPPSHPPPAGTAIPTSTTTQSTDSNPSNPVPPAPEPTQPPLPSTTVAELQNPNVPTSMGPTKESYPPEVVAQIHRLMQQQNQQTTGQQANTTQPPVVNNPNAIPSPGLRRQWHGVFSSATANGAQEAHIHVSVEFQQNAEPHITTWPQKIQISPAQEKAIPPREFHQWASQNNGILCKVTAQRRPETPPNNEHLLNRLIGSIAEKSMYAVAGWPLPNGAGVRKTLIMTAVNGMLMGAVFPLTGFSEMPKGGPAPQQLVQQPVQQAIPSQLSATSIPPELIPRLQMLRAMQARGNLGPPFTGNVGDYPGLPMQPGIANPAQQQQQIPQGINFDMVQMQALMRRQQDG